MSASTEVALQTESVQTTGAALILNESAMNRIMVVADQMAKAVATIPKHLQGKPSDCFAICLQATRWGMDPFVVAQKTHLVNGVLGYESQLVNAVLMSANAIKGRFHYEYRGDGEKMECRVGAIPAGESEIVWNEWLMLSTVATRNSPLWKTNPRQQLGYLQVKYWARQYRPDAILGVYTTDELEVLPPVHQVTQTPDAPTPSADQMDQCRQAASKGTESFRAHWKALDKNVRALFSKEDMSEFQALAKKADSAPIDVTEKKTGVIDADTGEMKFTYAEIMSAIQAAGNLDELDQAEDMINALDKPEQADELRGKVQARRKALGY